MAWEQAGTQSNFDAGTYAYNQADGRDVNRSGAAGNRKSSGGGWFGIGSYNIVGMNVSQVNGVIEKIESYINSIENHLKNVEPLADASQAFRSEQIQKAVADYIENVKGYCLNLASQLRAFEDKLIDAKRAWDQFQRDQAGNINNSGASGNFGSTAYQRQFTN